MLKLIPLIVLAATGIAAAQASATKGGLKVRFLAERAPEAIGQVMLVAKEAKSAPFDLPTNHLSDPQTPPQRVFSVWSAAKNVSLATVTLPEQGDSFIALLIPAAEGGYKPVVISAKDDDFRPGDIYFYNHADKTVLGYVGTAKFTLAPALGKVLRPAGPSTEGPFYEIGLGVREQDGDRPLSTARWPVQKDIRMYVFFFINPRTQRLDFRAVDEFVEPEPK
jgi:hypothetical protein